MPFLRFHETDRMRLLEVSREMTDKIQEALGCPREHIVLELINSERVWDGQFIAGEWPFVEVWWFERPLDVQNQVAQIIYACLKKVGYEHSDVYFHILENRNYYENGTKE